MSRPADDPAPTADAPIEDALAGGAGETPRTDAPAAGTSAAAAGLSQRSGWRERLPSDRSMSGPIARLVGLIVIAGILLGLSVGHWRYSPGVFLRPMEMGGDWIRAPGQPGHAGYFRRHVTLPGPVRHAWVAVAPMEGFEISVNRNPSGRLYLWRPTRPFQNGLSERGQLFNPSPPALALNFPREYQWSSHRNHWLPTFLDLTDQFRPGRNTICVEVESRRAPAMFRMEGEILLWSGERIRLDSHEGWKAEPVPLLEARNDWTEPAYSDLGWRNAIDVRRAGGAVSDVHFRSFDERVLTTPFTGHWLRSEIAGASDSVWFETEWVLPQRPDDAWLRLASNRSFDLFINDHRVSAPNLSDPDLDTGDWVLGSPRGGDLPAMPELLDPEEVGSLFTGNRFESPRHGDPTERDFKLEDRRSLVTRDKARATTRSDLPGTYDTEKEEGEGVQPHDDGLPPQPESQHPKALGRDRAIGGVMAYNVRTLVRGGSNTLRVRLSAPLSPEGFLWPPQLAIDGEARSRDGSRDSVVSDPHSNWTTRVQAPVGSLGAASDAVVIGPAHQPGEVWPKVTYRGLAHDTGNVLREKLLALVGTIAVIAVLAIAALNTFRLRAQSAGTNRRTALIDSILLTSRLLLPPIALLLAAQLVKVSWAERHEAILFKIPRVWPLLFIAATLSPLVMTPWARRFGIRVYRLPETRIWWCVIGVILVGCGVLRTYKLDFQPLDDDEYASVQAILSIAQTGVPKFVPEGIYYTRSPAFHYLVGATVWAFGENLWAMRLPGIFFGVATAALMVRLCERLLQRPWVGFASAMLYTLHPLAIFSASQVRFYQQQQFFSMLAVYFFCLGFLGKPSQKYRYLTALAFFVAVLSQEISAVMAFQLVLGMFVFGRDAGWSANLRLLLVAGVAIGFILLDWLAFQTLCLTRMEGVSPSIEASIRPHFWDPYNLLSLFIGYSRLHIALSVVLAASLWLLLKRGGRVVWALCFFLVTGVILTNLMVTNTSLRYQSWMLPLWLILALRGLEILGERLAQWTRPGGEQLIETRALGLWLTAPILLACVLAWSPWRVLDSYDYKLLGDSTGAFRFVSSQLRPGDAVAATEPHPHAALLEVGRVDYDLTVPLLYDYVVLQDGRLIDRNGGAEVISSLDELIDACRRHERLWVVVNREKFRTRGKNIRWEYPAARIELFLRKNMQIAHRDYLWTVFLWDRSRGTFNLFRES